MNYSIKLNTEILDENKNLLHIINKSVKTYKQWKEISFWEQWDLDEAIDEKKLIYIDDEIEDLK